MDRIKKFVNDHPLITTFASVMTAGYAVTVISSQRDLNKAKVRLIDAQVESQKSLTSSNRAYERSLEKMYDN